MKGLIFNNLYSVEKSIKSSTLLATAIVIGLILAQNPTALRVAIFLPFLLIPVHAFEVLKHDAMSGWSKFEITLPVSRQKIVSSKYMTFLLLFFLSAFIIFAPFLLTHIFIYPTINEIFFNFLLRGAGLILCIAALTYPLTYILGTEKADFITMMGVGFSFGIFFGIYALLQVVMGAVEGFDQIFSMTFISVSILLLLISYVVSSVIYRRKEF